MTDRMEPRSYDEFIELLREAARYGREREASTVQLDFGGPTLYLTPDELEEMADGFTAMRGIADRHVVELTLTNYGLQHPLRCRPDLIGCHVNRYLAALDGPERPPGRYVITLTPDEEQHGRWRAWYEPDPDVAPSELGSNDG